MSNCIKEAAPKADPLSRPYYFRLLEMTACIVVSLDKKQVGILSLQVNLSKFPE